MVQTEMGRHWSARKKVENINLVEGKRVDQKESIQSACLLPKQQG